MDKERLRYKDRQMVRIRNGKDRDMMRIWEARRKGKDKDREDRKWMTGKGQ